VALLEALLRRVGLVLVVEVLVLLRNAEVDERPRPQIAQAHRPQINAVSGGISETGRCPLERRSRLPRLRRGSPASCRSRARRAFPPRRAGAAAETMRATAPGRPRRAASSRGRPRRHGCTSRARPARLLLSTLRRRD